MGRNDVIEELRSQIGTIEHRGACARDSIPAGKAVRMPAPQAAKIKPESSGRQKGNCGESEASRAFKKIVELVSVSDRSEKALRERLARHGFSDDAVNEAIGRAKACSFVDDRRFAEVLVRSRVSQGKGSAGIERELSSHGIDPVSVDGWPEQFGINFDSEVDRALDMLESRPPRSKNLREGAYRKLLQKGYPASVCASAARIWFERQQRQID